MNHLLKSRLLVGVGLLLAVASCRKDNDSPLNPGGGTKPKLDSEGVELIASERASELYQLDTVHFTASGPAITDPASVKWEINGKDAGQGKTLVFEQRLPGSYEVILRYGKKGLAKTFTVRPRFEEGMLLLNEGNQGNETGKLTYINVGKQVLIDSAYQRVNPGHKLGNVAQDLAFANGKIYVVSQNGAKNGGEGVISIMKQGSLEALHVFNDPTFVKQMPTHIAVVGDLIYLRVENIGIQVGSETGGFTTIPDTRGARKMRMVTLGQRVYALSGSDKILVLQGKQVVATFTLPKGKISSIAPAADGNLWVAYTEPNTLAKLNADPRDLKLLATHPIDKSLAAGWGAASILASHGDKLYFAEQNRKVYVHDFTASTTQLFFDFETLDREDLMKIYYNSLGVDLQGNVYFAGLNAWDTYKEKNRLVVVSADGPSPLLTKDKVNSFPAGFFAIPAKK